jgi:hypothetical protein
MKQDQYNMQNHKERISEDICSINVSQISSETVMITEQTIGESGTAGDNLARSLCSSWQ